MPRVYFSLVLLLGVFILVGGLSPAAAAATFDDTVGHWAEEAVGNMVDAGVIRGFGDGTFRPDASLRRAEFITVLARTFALEPAGDTWSEPAFPDIAGHWGQAEIEAAVAQGLVLPEEYGTGRFEPDGIVTRLEMARWILRAMGLGEEARARAGEATNFADDDEIAAADKGYVSLLADNGIITGYEDGTFRPGRGLNRAEAAVVPPRIGGYEAAWTRLAPNFRDWYTQWYVEQQEEGQDEIPSDYEIGEVAAAVYRALANEDGAALALYVHPDGLRFSPYTFVDVEQHLVFHADLLASLWADAHVYTWGSYDGTGAPIELTFSDYAQRFIYTDFTADELAAPGFNEILGSGNTINNVADVYPASVVVEFHQAGRDPQLAGMDWRSLRLVFTEHEGEWLLNAIVNDQWTI